MKTSCVAKCVLRSLLLLPALAATTSALAAPVIPNPSFELNTFTGGQGEVVNNTLITGWAASNTALIGLNPVNGANPIADNGKVPHGANVAFIRSQGGTSTLSTTITGLIPGKLYRLQFRYNRNDGPLGNFPRATCRVGAEPAVPVRLSSFPAVNLPGFSPVDYRFYNQMFVARGATAALEISNTTALDSTLLVDNFLITEGTSIQVTNANNDGPGSLRQALVSAAATPAFNVITFAPALSGQSIALISLVIINDNSGVAIDAAALPKGIVFTGPPAGTTTAILDVQTSTYFRAVNISGGAGASSFSGAMFVRNAAVVSMSRCAMFQNGNNAFPVNGGAVTMSSGALVAEQCTFSQNVATLGGAIAATSAGDSRVFLDHCTIAKNVAANGGGGIFNQAGGQVTATNCIISANTCPNGNDIHNTGASSKVTYLEANIVDDHLDQNTASTVGSFTDAAANASDLDDNGGPTRTMALLTSSVARNAATNSHFTSDQRGRPVQNAADIGAYEVQPGTFSVVPNVAIAENAGPVNVLIKRQDGFEGTATVKVSSVPGTAGAGDFQVITNQLITFPDGQDTGFPVVLDITPDGTDEANEHFSVVVSGPSQGSFIGTPSSATIVIVDGSFSDPLKDKGSPTLAFTNPAGATMNVDPTASTITVTGAATDNKGVRDVNVAFSFDEGPLFPVPALVEVQNDTSVTWRASFGLGVPASTMRVQAQAFDATNHASPLVTRTVTLQYPLNVIINGNGNVTPAGFTPRSFRSLGQVVTLSVTPSPGAIFANWSVQNATASQIGLAAVELERPTVTFMHVKNLGMQANLLPSPYTAGIVGTYKGLMTPTVGPSGNNTEGLFDMTLTSTGAFSGNLTLDGQVIFIAGSCDHLGVARFGTSRARVLRVPRAGKPSLLINITIDGSGTLPSLRGQVDQVDFRDVLLLRSEIVATRTGFNGTTALVAPQFLGPNSTNAVYNLVLEKIVPGGLQTPGFNERMYPQGHGIGRLTLTKAGVLTLTDCTLADGTIATASTFVDQTMHAVLYLPLYNRGGFLRTQLVFAVSNPGTDVTGGFPKWARPAIATSHFYRDGWPEVINVNVIGAIYRLTDGQSALRRSGGGQLTPPDSNGNANLAFQEGQLSELLVRSVNFSTSDALTKIPATNPTFTLSFTRATGIFNGTFRHTDSNTIPFKGIILNKDPSSFGYGFFLTAPTNPIDFSGEGGRVSLFSQ